MIGRFILLLVLMELTGSVPGEPTRSKAAANQVSNGRIMEYTVSRVFPSNVGPLAMIRPEKIFQDHGAGTGYPGAGNPKVLCMTPSLIGGPCSAMQVCYRQRYTTYFQAGLVWDSPLVLYARVLTASSGLLRMDISIATITLSPGTTGKCGASEQSRQRT